MADKKYLIELENISKSYTLSGQRKLQILHDVCSKFPRNAWSILLGASGSGKTTLLNLIGALEAPDAGSILFDGTDYRQIMRSAAALGMDAVLATPTCCDPLYRRAVRVSMGTVFQVPWTRIGETPADWPEAGIARLHTLGFKTAAMALSDNSVSIDDEALHAEEKLAIILGTEGDGLSPKTIADCDYTVKIPMSHEVDSLNVAAASAVAFWELRAR